MDLRDIGTNLVDGRPKTLYLGTMNTTRTRKCGSCDKMVATKLDLDAGEVFVVHLDRGWLCPGSKNAAVGNRILARAARQEVR